jgi:hypothetical protein
MQIHCRIQLGKQVAAALEIGTAKKRKIECLRVAINLLRKPSYNIDVERPRKYIIIFINVATLITVVMK